jgi:hypothetical protein
MGREPTSFPPSNEKHVADRVALFIGGKFTGRKETEKMDCIHSPKKGTAYQVNTGVDQHGKFLLEEAICKKCNRPFHRRIYPGILSHIFSIPKKTPKISP